MKRKQIIAVLLAATLMLSGSLTAWATEDIQNGTEQGSEPVAYAAPAETGQEDSAEAEEPAGTEESEEIPRTDAEESSEAAGINEAETENAETENAEIEAAEIEAAEPDDAEAGDLTEIPEAEEISEDFEEEDSDELTEDADAEDEALILIPASEMTVGAFMGMKEIDEYDPDLLEIIHGADNGIQPFATTEYTKYSCSYNYATLSFSSAGGYSGDEILAKAVSIINGNEGGYNSVVRDDNGSGAPSIGKIQWWAQSAKLLAQLIVSEDNATAYKLLGKDLYNEIIDESITWAKGTRVFSKEEQILMQNFLDPDLNPASKTIQDKMADSYVASYLNEGYSLGIRNAAALVYFADLDNQYGYTGGSMGGAKACAQYAYTIAGSDWSKVTLNELHLAAVANVAHNYAARSNVGSYLERRRSTYGKLATCGWTYCNSGDYLIPYNSDGSNGAAWLQVALNKYANAGLTVTGEYDDALKAAVTAYQQAAGLTADGLAGRHTTCKLIHDMYYKTMTTGADMGSVSISVSTREDIKKIDGTWTYTVDGEPDYSYTGLAKNSNGWYYIKNGELDRTYTGFATNENGSWYITNGKLTRKDNTVIKDTKGVLGDKDEWYYVVGSKVQYGFTGLANYKNDSGWWYITDGRVDRSYKGLAKNTNGWYYLTNGKVDRSYTGYATNENGSWYVTSGKLTRKDNTVIKDTKGVLGDKNEWYYVVGSKVQSGFTGLANYKNASGWWYITDGRVDRTYKGLAKNKNGWYYLTNGKVNRSYTGFATNENGSWYVTNGKLTRKDNTVIKDTKGVLGDKGEWYYVVGSKVQSSFTGLANYKNASGWWYITEGRVDRTFTGIAQNKNGWYYIKNGKVQHGFTGTVTAGGTTYSVTNGKVKK